MKKTLEIAFINQMKKTKFRLSSINQVKKTLDKALLIK